MTIAIHGYPDWQPGLGTTEVIALQALQAVAAGNALTTALIDMRPYSSFGILAETSVGAAPAAFNTSGMTMTWYLDTGLSNKIWQDGWAVHNFNQTASPFDVAMNQSMIQDNVRGPYLIVSFANNGPQIANMSFSVYGSSRTVSGRSLRELNGVTTGIQQASLSTLLYFSGNVAAGVTRSMPVPMAPGGAMIVANSGAGANGVTITGASGLVSYQAAAFTAVRDRLVLPDESCIVRLINGTAGILNMNVSLTADRMAA